MVVRGGYGIYYDNPVYQSIATQMAQQAPLSTSLRVQNSAANPLTLATGSGVRPTSCHNLRVDPSSAPATRRTGNFRCSAICASRCRWWRRTGHQGHARRAAVPAEHVPVGRGQPVRRVPQRLFLYDVERQLDPPGRNFQLRRRLRRGFTSESNTRGRKRLDNAALGGTGFLIAQNWLDLRAERGRSNFDQRHVVVFQTQYTTGAGSGGFLTTAARALFREWTVVTQLNYGTGLPLTPTSFSPVSGTGVTGSIRANYTGADPYDAPAGLHLNPAAYTAPGADQWGNAGRNTITGPAQFSLNASASRTFRWGDHLNADLRVDATNALNHPVFPSWNTVITSAQFGLPNPGGPDADSPDIAASEVLTMRRLSSSFLYSALPHRRAAGRHRRLSTGAHRLSFRDTAGGAAGDRER